MATKGVSTEDGYLPSVNDCVELCFNLQGVERYQGSEDWPWSIRQSVAYHRINLSTGACTWLMVKANKEIMTRILEQNCHQQPTWHTFSEGISHSLPTYILMAAWSVENWRWYLDFLEKCLNDISRPIFQFAIGGRVGQSDNEKSRDKIEEPVPDTKKRWLMGWFPRFPVLRFVRESSTRAHGDLELGEKKHEKLDDSKETKPSFAFVDLQNLLYLEEKVEEAILVIQGNMRTLSRLADFYTEWEKAPFRVGITGAAKASIKYFAASIDELQNEMRMQEARSQALLSLVTNRKTMVCKFLLLFSRL